MRHDASSGVENRQTRSFLRSVLDAVALRWRLLTRKRFDNERFWDHRYSSDVDLGSGVGSRGLPLQRKRAVLQQVVEELQPISILDVGCGDMVVGDALPADGYLGVDVSNVAIRRHSAAYPDRRFLHGDFLELDLEPADLVVCLDVLIHIDDSDVYSAIVRRLVDLTTRRGLVAGYESSPPTRAPILFFHEALSDTLVRAGATNVRDIGGYNQVRMFSYEPKP